MNTATVETRKAIESKVIEIKELTESTFKLKFERNGLDFKPGQYINLGIKGLRDSRAYSIYSSPDNIHIELLIKEVPDGIVSRKLRALKADDIVTIDGPFGSFVLNEKEIENKKFLFVSSGTGIAPFHSMIKSFPKLNYQLLHGVRYTAEAYDKDFYPDEKYTLCTSRAKSGDFRGRVTDFLYKKYVEPDTLCYLCGNHKMVYDVFEILQVKGVPEENIFAEVYF